MSLTTCTTCNSEIARTAEACPKCGAKNTYINPHIQRFINDANAGKFSTVIEYEYSGDQIAGRIPKEKSKILWIVWAIGLGIQVPALILSTFFHAFDISQPLMTIGVIFCSIGVLLMLYNSFIQKEKVFIVEYKGEMVEWKSVDDIIFDEYKRYFIGQQ